MRHGAMKEKGPHHQADLHLRALKSITNELLNQCSCSP